MHPIHTEKLSLSQRQAIWVKIFESFEKSRLTQKAFFQQQQNQAQQDQIQELLKKFDDMQAKLDILLHKLYGKKSEKKPPSNPDNDPPPKPPQSPKGNNTTKNGKPKKQREFPDDMRREIIKHDLNAEEKKCSCRKTKHFIGKEVSEYFDKARAASAKEI